MTEEQLAYSVLFGEQQVDEQGERVWPPLRGEATLLSRYALPPLASAKR